MSLTDFIRARAAVRGHNLLMQELRESRERARLGGVFYPVATLLAFAVAGREFLGAAVGVTAGFALLAAARLLVPAPPSDEDDAGINRRLRAIWTLVLVTTLAWGGFSAWTLVALPPPAPMVAVLFSGAFGMALAHTLCMRRAPAAAAILAVMLPSQLLLWRTVSPGVGAMWTVYLVYMLLVMARSHREYRARLELEEDLRQQRDLFEKQSQLDGLTGLANRREFADALARSLARPSEAGPTSLLIIDVDHFKHVNDSVGHLGGDACLVALAQRLRDHFDRPGDVPVRLGGEEFGVVVASDCDDACARGDAFRKALAEGALSYDGAPLAITVSIGCGRFDAARHADADALYRDVDAALYRAKLGGRNRVVRTDDATDVHDAASRSPGGSAVPAPAVVSPGNSR